MQTKCYTNNFNTKYCIKKCKFYNECRSYYNKRFANKELYDKIKKRYSKE